MATNDMKEYVLESDKEADRLARNHECIKYFMDGKLIKAPLDTSKGGLKVLDIATSDGTWIFDAQSSLPADTTFVGTDISPERLPKSTSKVEFVIQDINKPNPPSWSQSFDLVHARLVLPGAGPNAQGVVNSFYEVVKPGGWIQLIEAENIVAEDDGPAHNQFVGLMLETFRSFGVENPIVKDMATWVKTAGFENVREETVPYVLGKKINDESLSKQGVESTCVALEGLIAYAKTIPGGVHCMPVEDLDTLVDRFRAEMYERGGYYPLRMVLGQKPVAN